MLDAFSGYGFPYGGCGEAQSLSGGLPPARVLKAKPSGHWQGLMSLSEARQEVGVYGDSSQDDLIIAKLGEAIGWVEDLRGPGRPLTRTEFVCYYPDLAARLALSAFAPMPALGAYSGIAVVLTREAGDETVDADDYFLDASGAVPALSLNDYSALRGAGFKRGVENPVRVECEVAPSDQEPDWIGCRGVVKAALNMAYMAKESTDSYRGLMTTLARMMPNRTPLR